MNGTLLHQGNRHTLRFEREFRHPIEKVWRAITQNEELDHWFPAQIRGPREAGATLAFVFPARPGESPANSTQDGPEFEGRMIAFDPPRLLEFSWGEEVLRFELRPSAAGTAMVFTHTFEDVAKSARDAAGWEFCLRGLERRLDGLELEAFEASRFEGMFRDYARRFGPEASSKREPGA